MDVPDGALVGLRGAWFQVRVESATSDPHPTVEVAVGAPVNEVETVDEIGVHEFRWRVDEALASCATGCVMDVPVTISQIEPGHSVLLWSAMVEVRTDDQNPELDRMMVTLVGADAE